MLDEFDYAVIEYANSIGVSSETVYRWIEKYDLPYRDRCTLDQLFEALESVKRDRELNC